MDHAGSDDLIAIARAVRTRGLKGEIVAELLTDFPERFKDVDELVLVSPSGERKLAQVEDYWFQKNRVVLKLADYDDVEAAKQLVGYDFAVHEADRVPLDEDEFYDWELEGCTVKVGDKSIGRVQSVMKTGGAEILVITDGAGKEQLVPLAAEIVVNIDTAARVILIDPPEGLLDL
ncbi:MAG TPA: ribosome maturation factor RimM [Pyrinomonadaceae bacterium]|nr:ribosome maturation factor RimM [Pyrinomonadaceae bacterium]